MEHLTNKTTNTCMECGKIFEAKDNVLKGQTIIIIVNESKLHLKHSRLVGSTNLILQKRKTN